MSELGKRSEPGVPPEQTLGEDQIRRFVDLGAQNELFFRITGSQKVYDASDPSVATNVEATVQRALATGEFTDPTGAKCKIPHWDNHTKLTLAIAFTKRTIFDRVAPPK